MGKLTSTPALGSNVSKKAVQRALKGPLPAVAYAPTGTAEAATVNEVIVSLMRLGLMTATDFGPELFNPAAASLGSGVTFDGTATFTATSGIQMVGEAVLTAGRTYRVYFEWTATSGVSIRVNNSATNGGDIKGLSPDVMTNTSYELTFVADAPDFWLEADGAAYNGTIQNISITEVLNP